MKYSKRRAAIAFLAIALLLSISIFVLCSCGEQNEPKTKTEYSILLKSQGGMSLSDVKISVYADEELTELVWAGYTESDESFVFEAYESDKITAVLSEIPEGYTADEKYPLTSGANEISLECSLLEEGELSGVTYKIGNMAHDFTVTAYDGESYKLSELLETKKAVVLNFWFMNCDPCRMEFPYLWQAYEEFSDDIAVLAMNPLDGTDETIAFYAAENSLGFPMAAVDPAWQSAVNITAYPTTVIIDRYGMVSLIHTGSITEKETFVKLFEYYTSDDYVQSAVRNVSDIEN